jgi:hypothetical protein
MNTKPTKPNLPALVAQKPKYRKILFPAPQKHHVY